MGSSQRIQGPRPRRSTMVSPGPTTTTFTDAKEPAAVLPHVRSIVSAASAIKCLRVTRYRGFSQV